MIVNIIAHQGMFFYDLITPLQIGVTFDLIIKHSLLLYGASIRSSLG
ncbi:protein of unknown function [Xenorhabdus doucetiae]|uniref:Uncharacterized protein n=1 Tax=Xenorhabdus doucetiae TaxID=351671 RepID=A0A068QXM5_9GAMM|nr:protein of unknown function [Xenorhabdus doucetiae]